MGWYLSGTGKACFIYSLIVKELLFELLRHVITDDNWHHVVATRNGSTGDSKIYVDGILKGSATQILSGDFSSPTAKLNLGSYAGSSLITGNLDEVAVHNVELSFAQITMHYNNGLSGKNYYSPTAPEITSTPVTTGTMGDVYTYDVNASGYPYPTYSLTTFHIGMEIDPNTGVINWTPPFLVLFL